MSGAPQATTTPREEALAALVAALHEEHDDDWGCVGHDGETFACYHTPGHSTQCECHAGSLVSYLHKHDAAVVTVDSLTEVMRDTLKLLGRNEQTEPVVEALRRRATKLVRAHQPAESAERMRDRDQRGVDS